MDQAGIASWSERCLWRDKNCEPMKIRSAIASELEHLREVRNLSAQAGCRAVYSSEQLLAWLTRPLPEKMLLLIKEGFVLVAEVQEAIVGYGALDPNTHEVEAVFVLPSFAGRGIGRALLGALESRALSLNIKHLHLAASLNAVPFYRAAGYISSTRAEFPLEHGLALEYENMAKSLCAA